MRQFCVYRHLAGVCGKAGGEFPAGLSGKAFRAEIIKLIMRKRRLACL
ncbi:hypothetical protein HMPREF9120_00904 [Neisseria sp. oral taxon 020 str. F0370]|nr:hypothetical protein HMPREF9120_00904 [Neisseria sp. oral taxon 020 str. F0370]